jgi:hypothetical protein
MNNLVPLPYSRIAVQHIETDLDEAAIRTFLHHKETWFETDYVVFRRGRNCAVAKIEKTIPTNSFCRITSVEVADRRCTRPRQRRNSPPAAPGRTTQLLRAGGVIVSSADERAITGVPRL